MGRLFFVHIPYENERQRISTVGRCSSLAGGFLCCFSQDHTGGAVSTSSLSVLAVLSIWQASLSHGGVRPARESDPVGLHHSREIISSHNAWLSELIGTRKFVSHMTHDSITVSLTLDLCLFLLYLFPQSVTLHA